MNVKKCITLQWIDNNEYTFKKSHIERGWRLVITNRPNEFCLFCYRIDRILAEIIPGLYLTRSLVVWLGSWCRFGRSRNILTIRFQKRRQLAFATLRLTCLPPHQSQATWVALAITISACSTRVWGCGRKGAVLGTLIQPRATTRTLCSTCLEHTPPVASDQSLWLRICLNLDNTTRTSFPFTFLHKSTP